MILIIPKSGDPGPYWVQKWMMAIVENSFTNNIGTSDKNGPKNVHYLLFMDFFHQSFCIFALRFDNESYQKVLFISGFCGKFKLPSQMAPKNCLLVFFKLCVWDYDFLHEDWELLNICFCLILFAQNRRKIIVFWFLNKIW